jgi:hypothetical protein
MIKHTLVSIIFLSASFGAAVPVLADGIPKFGSTCVGDFKQSTKICISSDGATIRSSYIFRGRYPTKGTHTGCSLAGNKITCTGGKYQTSQSSGAMNTVVVTMKNSKPISMAWR